MMFLLDKVKGYVNNFFILDQRKSIQKEETSILDVYLEKLLSILTWSSKEQTLKTFFWFNTFFWIILMLNIRLYGVVFLIGLHIFIYDVWWRDTLQSEFKGEYSVLVGDMKHVIVNLISTLKMLRRDSPLMFTSSMALLFLTLRLVSSSISGHVLTYLIFLIAFTVPVCFKILPEDAAMKIKSFIATLNTPKCILAEDELIPFIQGKDFNRKEADMESLLTDRTADSVTNSLASGISAMPSYLEIAETPGDIEEEDLLPRAGTQGVSFTPGELSSDSDSENREIRFDSDHFNTSSSEEDHYAKDLRFSTDVKDGEEISGIKNMISNVITSVSGNLVTNMFQSALSNKTQVKKTNSESDSDFEIVDREDISEDYNN